MKYIILTLCLFSLSLQAQDLHPTFMQKNEDKINHLTCGYIIGFAGNGIVYEITKNKHIAFVSGIALSFLAGHLKEKYDENNNKSYNNVDMLSTGIGGFAGSFTVRLIIGKTKHRSKVTIYEYWECENENGY